MTDHQDRRTYVRYPMGRGQGLIEAIQACSPIPRARVRVLDWSLGGALVAWSGPASSALVGHWVSFQVKLPPHNVLVETHARVSHVRALPDGSTQLGLTFDLATFDTTRALELDAWLRQRLPQLQPKRVASPKPALPSAEHLARESGRLARTSQRLKARSLSLAAEARQQAIRGDRRQAKLLASESRQLEERCGELERESRLCAARCQQQADRERLRAISVA